MEAINKKITDMQKRVERMKTKLEETYTDLDESLGMFNVYLSDLYVAENTKQWSRYPIVTLCGSTRFRKEFEEVQKRLTLDGYVVLSVGLFGHSGDTEVWEGMAEDTVTDTKMMLDSMHKQKIDMSDEIFVINPGGYIGSSTEDEIRYAEEHGKKVRYLTNEPGFSDIAGQNN